MVITEEMREKARKTIEEKISKRPNFKIGPYQIRTDDVCYWFEDDKGNIVTGFHAGMSQSMFNELKDHMVKKEDLSGDVDTFIAKYIEARHEADRIFKDTLKQFKKEIKKWGPGGKEID